MIMATDNKDKVLNVPNLRFPEFKEVWKDSNIGKCFDLYSGNTPSRMEKEHFIGDVYWITSGELKEHYIGDTKERISEKAAADNNLRILPVGTFVMAIYGLEAEGVRGTCSITVKTSTISQACMAFTPKSNVSNEFLYSWYKKHGNKIGIRYAQGTKQQNLSYDIIEKFPIRYPSIEEQEKLNTFISLLDSRIATQNKIIEQLQSLIKGIVVSITTETPNTRIDKCLVCHSSTLQENHIEDFGDFPVYGANGICGYTVNADFNEPAILIVKDGSGVGNVRFVNGKYSVIGTQNILTPQNRFCLKYIFYCLQAFNFMPYKTGMAIPHIYFKDYGKTKIYCPNFEQQVKIASQIDLIESKIEIETQLLNKYEEQKKFLLSNMFI